MNTTNTKHSGLFLFPLFVAVFLLTSVFSESVKAVPCGVTIATLTPCVCIGNTNPVHLIANPTGGSNPATYVYLWSTGASTKEIDVFPAITTTYSVTVTGGGCSATPVVQASITINAYNTPSASFTISPPPLPKKCASTEFTFIPPAVPPGEPTPVYSWTFVDQSVPPMPIAPSAQASPKRTFYKIGYGEFQVKVHLTVTRCGCQDDFEQLITVKQLPDVKLFATPANWTQCSMSSNFTLVVHPSVDDPLKNQDYKIDWESPNPLPTTGTKLFPFPVAGESNTYSGYNKWTVRYTVTSATNGCINDTVYSAFNGGNPYPALNCPGTVASTCDLPYPLDIPWNPAHMNNTPGTIYVFDYFDNDPGTVTTETRNYPLAGTGLQITYGVSSCGYTPTAPSPFAGTQNSFAIRCTVTNQCVTTGAFPPQIHDCFTGKYGNKPDPDFTIKDAAGNQITSGCTNAPITLTSTTTSLNSGGSVGDCSSAMTLNWVITPATYTIVSGLPTDPVFVVKFDPANTYTITLEASNTCPSSPASIIKSLCITDESPVALFDINVNPANPNSCSEVTLETVNSSSAADPCGLVHYTWSTTYNGGTCSGSPGTPVYVTGNSTSFEPVIKLVDPGTYILKLVVNNSCGSAEYTKTIVVKGPPKVTISTSSTPAAPPYCAGNTYTFNMNVESCFGTLIPGSENWYLDPPSPVPPYGIPPVTGLSFTPLLSAGPHTIIAEVENECGIGSKTINITLSVSPTMTLSIAPATSISVCSQDNICLIYPGLFVSSTATTFKWTSALITGSISGFTNNSGTAGTCITDILTNSLLTTGIVRYTITPATLGCDGPPVVLDVFVKPKPSLTVTNPAGPPFVESICNGDNTFIKLSTDIPSTISWVAPALTNVNPVSAGGGASPVTVTNTLTLANASNPGSAVYTFTVMSAGGCPGPGATVTENVNTIPVLTTLPLNKTICSTDYTGISLTPVTNNYSWTATLLSGSVTGFSGNSGTFINQQLTNVSSTTAGVVRYVITPQALPCSGSSYNFDVTVNPRPVPTITPCNATVFFGDVITYHTETGKSNYSWVVNGGSITGGGGTADDFVTVKWTSGTTGSVCVNYQLVTGSLGCAALAPVCCNVVVNPCPLTQTVTLQSAVNGSLQNYFCEGDPGIDVCVGNSEPGIYYEIIYSGTGTSVRNYTGGIGGGPFCFAPPLNITGTYYVQATNIASGCVVVFSPPFSILKVTPPGIPAVTPTGPECENPDGTPPGVVLGLSGWQTGIDYEWRLGLGPWTLSGGPPILTTALSPGQYFARAVDPITGCISNAANSVWVMPKPIKYALFPFGVLCGCRDITLTNSQAGFKYKLINQSTGVTTLWISTGGSHVFQNICDTGTYVIEAQDTITPPFCTQQMDWSLTLIENPHSYSLLPSGPNCQGVELKLANSDPGVVYELRYMVTGDAVKYMHSLLGGELNFGILGSSYSEGTYKIFAKQGTSVNTDSCVTEMFGQIDLCRNPTPKIISPSGATCSLTTSTITLFNPDPTVTYHLIKDGNTGSPLISLTVGTPTLVFNSVNCVPPLPVFPAGTYTIRAVHTCPSISCELEFGIVNIEPGPSVDAGIPDPLTECAGAATVIPLLGTAADYDPLSVTWKVLIGPGTVSPTNTLGTQYTPGSAPGTRILRLEVSGVNSCVGIKQHDDRTIIINTLGQVNDPTDQVVCNGASTAPVSFTTINTGGTNIYTWTNSTTNIGLAATGTGNIPSFQAINTGSAPVTATIIVTPHFTTGGVTCDGPPETFTITVNPSAEVDQPVSQVVCQGTAVAATNFTTTTTGGTATYTWTNSTTSIGLAPSGTGDIAAFTAINAGTSPVTATIVVTPHFENGTVTCDGPSKSFTVTVNPAAAVDQPSSQVICNGSTTAAVSFTTTNTGGTVTYSWTNSTTTIGLAASGTGNIGTFTAINTGTSPVTATIIVTPHFENGSVTCDGSSKSFTVTVNPTGEVDQPQSQVLCNGSTTTPVNFTTTTTGGTATYTWTNSNTSIGLAANGTGNIAAFTALNTGTVPVTATITVTPHFENGLVVCDGPAKIFTVTVNPAAEVDQPVSQVLCNGDMTTVINFTTPNTGGTITFTWTNDTPGIGLAASGVGNIVPFAVVNTGTSPVTATITVTPHFESGLVICDGQPKSFTFTVNPTAQVDQPASQVVCNAGITSSIFFTTINTGGTVTYSWTNSVTTIGLAANGTGDIASFTAVNSGTIPVAATIVVTPHFESGSVVCDGPSKSFTITVNPTAEVDQPFSQVICNGSITAATIFTTANAGGTTTYTWTNDTPGIGLVSSGSGDIQAFTAINTGSVPVTATIIVTPHFENALLTCDGQPKSFTITVNPTAEVDQPSSQIVCQGAPTSLVVFTTLTTGGTTTYTWVNDTPGIGFPATGMGDIAPFFANNAGSGPVVATITVTPHFQHGPIICDGPAKSFTITVNPSAAVIQPVNQSVCSGSLTSAVNFTSSNTGGITTYTWTNSTTGIGLAGNGVGNIAAFIVVNTGILPVTATIVVTPHFENGSVICDGPSKSFTITANPTPLVPDQVSTICSGSQFLISPVNDPPLTVLPAGTTYSWSAPAVSSPLLIGGAAGTGMSGINGTLTNYSTSTQTAIYTVTPTSGTSGNCVGNSFTVTVEVVVAPTPTITSSAQAVTPCVNSSGNIYTTQPGMTNYLWSGIFPPNTYVTGPDPNSITVTWITPGIKSLTVSYSSPLCSQVMPPVPYQVFVEPQPVPSISTVPQGINECCIGDPAITFVTEDDMDTYVWTVNGGTKVAENGHTLSVVWNTVTSPSNITNVTVSYMNQFGCTAAAPTVYPFTVHALPPTPTINGDTAVCAGDVRTYSTEVGMADYQWSVFPVNNVTGLGTPVITVTWTEVGANLVTVYYKNSNGCYPASPRDTIINVYPLPVPEVEFGEQLVCDSTIYSYSTTPGKLFYEWSFDPGDASHIESGATTSSPTVHWIRGGVAVHHLFVNYSDAHGCRGIEPTPAYEVTVKELPVPSITSTFSDVCQYSDNNVYTTESGPLLGNYQWSVLPDGSITSGAGTPEITVTWNSTGAKTVSVTYTQDNCPATLLGLFSVAVNPLPNPSISGPDSVCQDKTETYVTQNNMSEYHWEVLGGTLQSADGLSFINVKWTDPGPRTISVNYKDAHGCKALFPTDSTVHVIGKPTLAISGPQNNICVGETGVYSTLPGQASYFWTIPSGSGTILSNGNYTVTVTWTTPGSQYLILKVTNDFGCDSVSNQYPVTVNPRPAISVNLGAPLTSCSDSLNNVYSTATGMSEYRWRISGGTFTSPPAITSNQVTVNWGATGPYWISVNYVNQYGCWAIADTLFEVSVSPRPKASFDYSIFSACDSSIILTNNSTPLNGSNTYMWNYGDGPAVMNQLPTFTHDYRSTNLHQPSYLVSLKVLNTNGCPDTASRMVRMQPCIQAGYMYNALLACSRYKVVFTDTSATPAQMVMHWKWEWDDGTPDTEYNNFKPAVTHIFQVAGTYHVRLTVGPVVPGIPASTVEQVIVISPTPLPSFTSTSVCKDQAAYFTDKTNYFGLDTTSVRIWYFNGNSVAPGDTSQVHNPSHIYTKIQYDSVKLFVSNAFGCMDSITRKIKVHGLPVASFTNAAACSGNTTLFTDKSVFAEAVLSAWRWGFDDPASSSDSAFVNNPGHRFDAAGDYQVWMRVTDLLGCYSTKDSTIHVNETPVSSFTITDNFNGTKGQVQMNNTTIGSNVSYAWSFENGLPTTSYEADPVTLFKDDGKHTIRLISTNTFDCADTTYYDYEFFFAGLYVPNAFSPTNTSASYAGIRYFLPVGMNLDEYQVQVFDSWGHLLWESTRLKNENGILGMPAEGWDGTYEGQLMPQGNYIWKISAKFLDGSQWEGSDIGVGKSRGTWGTVVLIR